MKRFAKCAVWVALWPAFIVAWTFAAIIDGPHEGHAAWLHIFRVVMRKSDRPL